MQKTSNYFEQAFIALNGKALNAGKAPLPYEQLQVAYQALFDALLKLLAAQEIDYDDFIEQELIAWASPTSNGNPCELPFDEDFLKWYTANGYKFSFLVLMLQFQQPNRDISAALLLACYRILNDDPETFSRLALWLDFLGDYPNPNAVGLVAAVLPLLNNDWYNTHLSVNLNYLLTQNPGLVATAVHMQLAQVEAKLEAENRV